MDKYFIQSSIIVYNPSKVKETLKHPDMALDNIRSTCLFDYYLEEKLLKHTNSKQKSKLIFSVILRKSSTNSRWTSYNSQPFHGGPLPQFDASGARRHFVWATSQKGKKNYRCIGKVPVRLNVDVHVDPLK